MNYRIISGLKLKYQFGNYEQNLRNVNWSVNAIMTLNVYNKPDFIEYSHKTKICRCPPSIESCGHLKALYVHTRGRKIRY